ncbi:antibiotic biosynthesis monooxygenase family protein [Photobacterium lipolyticum]|uniref:ABM domain-containing protein n=1 Tax=Photobacterium lipolyticum TaxID=266810 RepID=A0A2T3N319_9GAMM|nr:hypothetical protein [Photobacterium lipolyticum]PSW06763.1 hypothetical protein C9I89_04330 [Photobacterium lipolyticum]
MRYFKRLSLVLLTMMATLSTAFASDTAVIEIVTLTLKEGVSYTEFAPIDKAVEDQHVAKQPGFISRESAAGENGEWLVIVHWESAKDADASMASFMSASAAQKFVDNIDGSTMVMKRYSKAFK